MDRTGSGSRLIVGCGSRGVEICVLLPEGQLISKVDLSDIDYEDGRWIELAPVVACGVSDVETSVFVTVK